MQVAHYDFQMTKHIDITKSISLYWLGQEASCCWRMPRRIETSQNKFRLSITFFNSITDQIVSILKLDGAILL